MNITIIYENDGNDIIKIKHYPLAQIIQARKDLKLLNIANYEIENRKNAFKIILD